jgi:hypothetical protein
LGRSLWTLPSTIHASSDKKSSPNPESAAFGYLLQEIFLDALLLSSNSSHFVTMWGISVAVYGEERTGSDSSCRLLLTGHHTCYSEYFSIKYCSLNLVCSSD